MELLERLIDNIAPGLEILIAMGVAVFFFTAGADFERRRNKK